jgi:hypothetical protein
MSHARVSVARDEVQTDNRRDVAEGSADDSSWVVPVRAAHRASEPRAAATRAARPTPPLRPTSPTGHGGAGVPGRRTVQIQGRGAERYTAVSARRRPQRRPHERDGFRPDRAALWAVFLGVVLIVVAAASAHAAVIAYHLR